MKYPASYDSTVRVISTLVILLLIALTLKCVHDMLHSEGIVSYIFGFVSLLPLALLAICYVYSPQYYLLNERDFQIKRVVNNKMVLLSNIKEIRPLTTADMRGVIRTFGVGGLFGYFGTFRSGKLGKMNFYTTQSINRLLIELKSGEMIVITPNDIQLKQDILTRIST